MEGNKKIAEASAQVTYLLTKVNAVGRVFLNLTEGTKEVKNVEFHYTKADGWQVGKGKVVPQPAEPSYQPAPAYEQPASIFNQPVSEDEVEEEEPSDEEDLSSVDWTELLNALEMMAE